MIGLGSIGVRHLCNLHTLLSERGVLPRIDAIRSLNRPLPLEAKMLLSDVYSAPQEAPDDYDAVFITNPTSMHYETIETMLGKTMHMFIEKPVFDRVVPDWKALPWRAGGIYYIACPLRYSRVIKYLKEYLLDRQIFSARCICSTYLPDWRPTADYRQSYSARAELGGGVRLDLIHEWDYLQYLFGVPSNVLVRHGKYSNLETSSEDLAIYLAEYPDKLISVHLDYFGRAARREVELYLEDEVVVGDIYDQRVRFLYKGTVVPLPQERNAMQREEIACFLDMLDGKCQNHNSVSQAVNTLQIALGEISP